VQQSVALVCLLSENRSDKIRGMKSFALIVVLLAAACGSKSSSSTTPTGGGGGSAVAAPLPDVPFESLDHDQRIQFMKEVVVPTMGPLFKNHDAKKYAEFGCITCHGDGAKEGKFIMPNEKLPKLFGPSMDKFKKEDVEWMGKEIKPTMAKLLKEEEYSEANPKGFGCMECHTPEK
jgi:mono/diheme cytochrome c family protein